MYIDVFHEVRVPLNTLAMGMQVLDELLPELRQRRCLRKAGKIPATSVELEIVESMQNSTQSLVETVNQVLALHRIREGDLDFTERLFHLRAWLSNVIDGACGILSERRVNVELEIDDDVADVVVGDPERLEVALSSALSNLATYVPPDGTLHVRLSVQPPPNLFGRTVHVIKRGSDNIVTSATKRPQTRGSSEHPQLHHHFHTHSHSHPRHPDHAALSDLAALVVHIGEHLGKQSTLFLFHPFAILWEFWAISKHLLQWNVAC